MSYCQISPFGAHCIAEGLRENSSLQKLDISVNELFDNGAIAICNCLKNNFTLRELNISFNKITNTGAKEIAKAIKASNNLCTLNISGNHMTSEGIILFLCTIQTTSALKSLFIQFNNVTSSGFLEISEYIKGANLSLEIYLTWNDVIHHGLVAIQINSHFFNVHPQSELKAANVSGETSLNWPVLFVNDTNYAVELISTCLKDNCTLTKLDLLRIKIASEEAKKIAEVLEVNKTLQKLDISLQCIDDEGAMAIGESLKNNTTLQDLSIAISNNGIVTFLRTIEKNTGLVKLDLSSIWILPSSGEIVNALTSYLCNNATLQELNLSSTRFYEFEKIAEALHINTTLQKLIISYNHCHHWGRVIGNLLQNNRTLLELDVSNCNIGKDVEEISKGLEVNNSLQSLNISHNYLQDVGINCLREGLKVNSALQKLDLTENFIVKEGSMLIGMVIIQFNTTLQQLNVSQTLLTCEAMEAIGKYLRGNSSLLDISMSRCGITSDGAKHIAEAIELNTTLKKLDISYNRLVDAGAISIANSLKCNNTIQELNLSSTAFFNTGAEQIAEAVCVNKILQKLDVSHNSIDDRGVTAISECLKKNFTLQDLNISCTRVTNLAANKFAEVLQVNTSLHTLNLFQEAFFNALTFNMIILRAVHFNRFIMNLELPNTLHAVEVREEIEYINQERTRQGVHALCTNMDVKYLINDYTKLYSVCGKLSYL
ncbi:NLR family CARD domain-containing protein 3-like [Dysidea avara]|uniref:NLR family CARD domain-containing protein 3-like n=1 Tax=Dysidea avara TaxID=196820 RepID=UPI0033231762